MTTRSAPSANAFDLEARAVAVGEAVRREIGRLQFAGAVEIDRAFDAGAGALDQQILDARWIAAW